MTAIRGTRVRLARLTLCTRARWIPLAGNAFLDRRQATTTRPVRGRTRARGAATAATAAASLRTDGEAREARHDAVHRGLREQRAQDRVSRVRGHAADHVRRVCG